MNRAASEFSRRIDRRDLGIGPVSIEANQAEREALARRFGLVAIRSLLAEVLLEESDGAITARGSLDADIVQTCALSGDDLSARIAEAVELRFVFARRIEGEELELTDDDLDEIPFEGTSFDLGEEIAQSLALAIDPYAVGPEAEAVRDRHELGEKAPDGPLQRALKGLKPD